MQVNNTNGYSGINNSDSFRKKRREVNPYVALGTALAIGIGSTFALSRMDLTPPEKKPMQRMTYVVKPGDTLDAILLRNSFRENREDYNLEAVRYEVKVLKNGKKEELRDYNKIYPGEVLDIPVYYSPKGNKVDIKG